MNNAINTGANTMNTNEDTNGTARLSFQLWNLVKDYGNFTTDYLDGDRIMKVTGRCGFLDAVRVSDTCRGFCQGWEVREACRPGSFTVWTFPGLGRVELRFRHDPDNFRTGTMDLTFRYDRDQAKWGDNV